jgi:hypothetical protein
VAGEKSPLEEKSTVEKENQVREKSTVAGRRVHWKRKVL